MANKITSLANVGDTAEIIWQGRNIANIDKPMIRAPRLLQRDNFMAWGYSGP
jgi:hypothetical protein